MGTNEIIRRRALQSGGSAIDWESIARGMCDFSTPFEVPSSVYVDATKGQSFAYRGNMKGELSISSGVREIGYQAFYECRALTKINFPNTLTKIGGYSFYRCSGLLEVVVPDSVTLVDNYAFRECSSMTSMTFGSGVTAIGWHIVDARCTALTEMIFTSTTPPTLNNVTSSPSLGPTTMTFPIYVPDGSVAAYKTSWDIYANRIKGISERPMGG